MENEAIAVAVCTQSALRFLRGLLTFKGAERGKHINKETVNKTEMKEFQYIPNM